MAVDGRNLGQESLGELIRRRRDDLQLTQAELAERAGVKRGWISHREMGRPFKPTTAVLHRLADALEVPFGDVESRAFESVMRDELREYARRHPEEVVRGLGARSGPSSDYNVAGRVDDMRASWIRPLPIYQWGACGEMDSEEEAPAPIRHEYPPVGQEVSIGPTGFGVLVRGRSMTAKRIFDGDTVWVNPELPARPGQVVLARVMDRGGEVGMVVKVLRRDGTGEHLVSAGEEGPQMVPATQFRVIGPVVWVTSPGRPPG